MNVWTIIRFLHVIAAILWVGGQLTLSLVVRPASLRSDLAPEDRVRLMSGVGVRYGRIATIGLMPVILATGLALIYHHGVEFGGLSVSSYATTLTIKVILVFVSFALAFAHGFIAARSSSAVARWIGISSALVSVAIVFLAVMLVT